LQLTEDPVAKVEDEAFAGDGGEVLAGERLQLAHKGDEQGERRREREQDGWRACDRRRDQGIENVWQPARA